MKLTSRFSTNSTQRIKDLIAAHKTSVDVEIQQRACEYSKLFGFGSNVTNKLLERIPVIEEKQETLKPIETSAGSDKPIIDWDANSSTSTAAPVAKSLNIMEEIFGPSPIATSTPLTATVPTQQTSLLDLDGLLGGPTTPSASSSGLGSLLGGPSISPSPTPLSGSTMPNLLGPTLMSTQFAGVPAPAQPLNGPLPTFVGFQKNGLTAYFDVSKQASHPNMTMVNVSFANSNASPITNFEFKVAVPKYVKLQVNPASGNIVPPNNNGRVSQQLKLLNTSHGEKPPLLKIKLDYQLNGVPVAEIGDVSFPEGV